MQGYIINLNRVKDEDLIVTILTPDQIYTTYRFYGARHSTVNLGYKVDFELQSSLKSTIPQLRGVLHLGFRWLTQRHRALLWQNFIQLFYKHLKDVEEIDSFYFDLLENCSLKWEKQNPKRVIIEAYLELLEYEGRLHDEFICFNCEESIEDDPALIRGFLLAHKECVYSDVFSSLHVKDLLEKKTSLYLHDDDIERLWRIIQEGF